MMTKRRETPVPVLGTFMEFPDHVRYGSHRGHTAALVEVNVLSRRDTEVRWSCSCGSTWWVAWDPEGELGSEEAPEG